MDAQELRRTLVLANPFKEGDLVVGGTRDESTRVEARNALARLRVREIRQNRLIDDGVSEALARSRNSRLDETLDTLSIAQIKEILMGPRANEWSRAHADAMASEVAAAVVKLMTNDELASVASRLVNALPGRDVAIGGPGHFGSRIQPNSPGDDDDEIVFSILEGLTYGCGDVIIGLNPAADGEDAIVRLEELLANVVRRLELPTRYCVLSDILKQDRVRTRTRVDVAFQSLAGTSNALAGMVGVDVDELTDVARNFDALYFETGQGSAVTNGAAEGVDMVTLEARAYGVARHIRNVTAARWTIVNDVAGFIGPEVFKTAGQLERVCLEDCVMAKLHGLTMGLDICATFHMGIPPAELHRVTERVAERAAPAYLMAVAGNADPMLGYLTTSFRQHPQLRRHVGRQMASPMAERLMTLGVPPDDGRPRPGSDVLLALYDRYAKGAGDGRARLARLRERGFDLGYGCASDYAAPDVVQQRLQTIYTHARAALYATIDRNVIRDACVQSIAVRTASADREDYLNHPATGERIREDDARTLAAHGGAPAVQIVVSDGLNANAVNRNLKALLPALRRSLVGLRVRLSDTDVVVQNGRVRAGYHIGGIINAAVIVHVIGERPGTGLDTVSAYVTYGRDETGRMRWSPALDHSCSNAVCGVHPSGKTPAIAAAEIAELTARILEQRRSGVQLGSGHENRGRFS